MRRTARALHMSDEAMERVIRLTSEQQKREPAEILQACVEQCPGVEVWFIEGLDLWIPDMNKMNVVAPIVDSLQRIATRYNVAVLATVGAPKQKGKDRYYGRDASSAARLLRARLRRLCSCRCVTRKTRTACAGVGLPRAGRAEVMYFGWSAEGLVLTEKPDDAQDGHSAHARMMASVQATFKPGEPIVWRESLGPSATFYRWRKWALERRLVVQSNGKLFLPATGVIWTSIDSDSSLTIKPCPVSSPASA